LLCKYRFPVSGRFFLDVSVPIPTNSWIVELVPSTGRVTHIEVTVSIPREEWPRVTPNPSTGVKLHIETNAYRLPWIQRGLRSLQGLLSVFGFDSIELDYPAIQWIPDTQEEAEVLKLASFLTKHSPLPDHEIPRVSFDLVARAVMASAAATEVEIPLNFFRRGMLDLRDRQFIEAFYDFFFVVENLYAAGKFHKAAVLEAFTHSVVLCTFIKEVIADAGSMLRHERGVRTEFEKAYALMTPVEALNRLVELRGQLHHQTPKRRDNWHPEDQSKYELDALFLQAVCHKALFPLAERYIWDPRVVAEYEALTRTYGNEPHVG
jgi:hypothetical protein